MADAQALAALPGLSGLPLRALELVARGGAERSYRRGEFLFHAGSPTRGLILILEGKVRVVNERGGRRHLVHQESAGATLGEVPLFLGGGYPASAVAAGSVRCLFLSRDAVLRALAVPELGWFLLTRLSVRIRTLVSRLAQVSSAPVRGALAGMLLEQAAGSAPFALDGTQQEIAETLGTVREVVARELTALKRAGIIRSSGRGLLAVVDRRALSKIATQNRV